VVAGVRGDAADAARPPPPSRQGAARRLQRPAQRRPGGRQYWRSFEHLDRFARDPAGLHLPAWRWFNRAVKASGDVGIWHETYLVRAGGYEAIYGNMPRVGLAAAGDHMPIARRGHSAARRVGASTTDEVAVPSYPNP
jgi:hypothetical protein